jgi:hypothetical protein
MSRRPATVTQADVARIIRAAKQAGAAEVEVHIGKQATVVVRLNSDSAPTLVPSEEIVL